MSKLKKQAKRAAKVIENLAPNKVVMTFPTRMFYNDLDAPMFEPGKEYELEGADWIQRWQKRGGVIVKGSLSVPEVIPNPSVIVPPAAPSSNPVGDNTPVTGDAGTIPETEKDDGEKESNAGSESEEGLF